MFKHIKIFVLALLLPVSANANFLSNDPEERVRLSKIIMQWGEIIHSSPLKDFEDDEQRGSAMYHVRVNKVTPIQIIKLYPIPTGIYVCVVALRNSNSVANSKAFLGVLCNKI